MRYVLTVTILGITISLRGVAMSFIRTKEIPPGSGNFYQYRQTSKRVDGKVTTVFLGYVGKGPDGAQEMATDTSPATVKQPLGITDKANKKLLTKLSRTQDVTKKAHIWTDANLDREQLDLLVKDMVLSLPAGYYKLHGREYGTNLVDTIYEKYGWMPSMLVSESTLLGLQALHPEKVYASFTHGLDAIEIKH